MGNKEKIEELYKLLNECYSKGGRKCIEFFSLKRKRFWELAVHFDFSGLRDRCIKSNTLTNNDMAMVSYLASLVANESLLRGLEVKDDIDLEYLNN